jgi:DNA-binding CsgD family transcriptional regulator
MCPTTRLGGETLVVPAPDVPHLRRHACWEMAGACEALLAVIREPARRTPECFEAHLERFDAARGLLDSFGSSSPSEDVHLDPCQHSEALLAALHSALVHPQRHDHRDPEAPSDVDGVTPQLTPREAEVLAHLAVRAPYGAIAAHLHITVETVRSHARRIRRKYGVSTSRELADILTRL